MSTPNLDLLSDRLRWARAYAGLDTAKASSRAGRASLTEDLLQDLEAGDILYSMDLDEYFRTVEDIGALADVYGVSMTWLLIGHTAEELNRAVERLPENALSRDGQEQVALLVLASA